MNTPNVTVSGSVWGDIEYQMLAAELGVPMVADAVGRLTYLESWCLKNQTDAPPRKMVDLHMGKGACEALLAVELAVEVEGGRLRVRGTNEKLDAWKRYLDGKRAGGLARAENARRRAVDESGCVSDLTIEGGQSDAQSKSLHVAVPGDGPIRIGPHEQASRPPADEKHERTGGQQTRSTSEQEVSRNELSSLISSSLSSPDLEQAEPPLTPLSGGRSRGRSKPKDLPPEVHDIAIRTLGHIAKRTGVQYQGAQPHLKLIAARLREPGVVEDDLRKVIAYCWAESGLDWANKLDGQGKPMAPHLCPETLFGPQKFHKYLEPARTWFEAFIAPRLRGDAGESAARSPPAQAQASVIPIPLRKA